MVWKKTNQTSTLVLEPLHQRAVRPAAGQQGVQPECPRQGSTGSHPPDRSEQQRTHQQAARALFSLSPGPAGISLSVPKIPLPLSQLLPKCLSCRNACPTHPETSQQKAETSGIKCRVHPIFCPAGLHGGQSVLAPGYEDKTEEWVRVQKTGTLRAHHPTPSSPASQGGSSVPVWYWRPCNGPGAGLHRHLQDHLRKNTRANSVPSVRVHGTNPSGCQ